jgi:hypothetical protein
MSCRKGDIDDYRWILRDGPRRDAFHEFHWLPTRQGALLKTLPVHDPNDLRRSNRQKRSGRGVGPGKLINLKGRF